MYLTRMFLALEESRTIEDVTVGGISFRRHHISPSRFLLSSSVRSGVSMPHAL